jgi:translocation and assembly module TamB
LPCFRRPLLIGAGALGAAALASACLDRLAEGAFARVRPGLESSLSSQLDQQVRLGRYLGLRAWGVQLGPVSVSPRGINRSSLRVERLTMTLAPLASLRQGVPTLLVDLGPTTVTLEANARGQYWRAPARSRGQQPPRLDLRARLLQPAAVAIPAQRARYQLTSALALRPDQTSC